MSKLSLVTRAEFQKLPEEFVELIEGRVVMTPSPVHWHNELVRRLVVRLMGWAGDEAERVQFAPHDVVLDDLNIYQPDVLVLPAGTRPTGVDWVAPTPVWVAEIISPTTAKHDRSKLPHYADAGVQEAWLVYPRAERIEAYALRTGVVEEHRRGAAVASTTLQGFRLDLEAFFRAY